MKPEEIKKAVRGLKNIVEFWCNRPEEIEIAKLAIAALEKQVPKKPIYQGAQFEEEPTCPSCLRTLDEEVDINGCQMCLQRLDWGNEE